MIARRAPTPKAYEGDGGARHTTHLRGLNLDRVLGVAMSRPGSFTRAELVHATGLSAPTVGSLTADLIGAGLLKDLGTGPSRGGRRPAVMEFNARHGFIAAIDMGPTRTRLAVADLRGDQLAHRIVPTQSQLTPGALLGRLARSVRVLMKEAGAPMDGLLAVAAGAPGAVDYERGIVSLAPNLPGWAQVPMRDTLERALPTRVLVENDVNLAVMGEHATGAARGHDSCLFIHVGTGIGAGIMIDGEVHRGNHFQAGEIALMCMGPQYAEQSYGSRGCLETLAGLQAMAGAWPPASTADPRWLAELFDAAHDGDRAAQRVVDDTTRLLGIAIANACTVVDPSMVVLGGALFAQAEHLIHEVRKIVLRFSRAPAEIVVSALGKEAPLQGGLLLAVNEARRQLRLGLREGRLSAVS